MPTAITDTVTAPSTSSVDGIHQSDIIIRTALVTAIADLRRKPWLLDSVFFSLDQDTLTAGVYGAKEREQAKKWFLKTDIPVVMDYRMDDLEGNCFTISLVESVEAENTLGDVHYDPQELQAAAWEPLGDPFTPLSYDAATGLMTLPDDTAAELLVTTGMLVVDRTGNAYPVVTVVERNVIGIAPETEANFTSCFIKGSEPRLVTTLESLEFKETYRVGAHAHGEPGHLIWLHSVLVFILLRYKQELLEARGFGRSVISSAPFAKNEAWGKENMWTRFVSITGYVRHYWPKLTSERITSTVVTPLVFEKVGESATKWVPDNGQTSDTAAWFAQDGIGMKLP